MNHHKAISVIEQLMPTIKQAGAPESVLLDYAQTNNLAPAQLEKMAQVFNTAKTLTYLKKAADRGGSFQVVDTEQLLKDYTQYQPVAKAAAAPTVVEVGYNPYVFTHGMSKAAAQDPLGEDEASTRSPWRRAYQDMTEKQALARTLDWTLEYLDDQEARALEIREKVASLLRKTDRDFTHQQVVDDLLYTMGKSAGCQMVRQFLGQEVEYDAEAVQEKRAFDRGIRQHPTRLRILDLASQLLEHSVNVKYANLYLRQQLVEPMMGKQATAVSNAKIREIADYLADNPDRIQEGPTRYTTDYNETLQTDEPDHAEDISDALTQALRGDDTSAPPLPAAQARPPDHPAVKGEKDGPKSEGGDLEKLLINPLAAGLNKMDPLGGPVIRGMANKMKEGPKFNRRQLELDETRQDTERSLVLARLMQSDPMISEADPEMVQELYNSLQEISPEYVRDPSRLRMALREALEYGAVPMHTLTELADFRKTMAGSRRDEQQLESDRYKI